MNIGSLFPALQTVKPEARSEATSAREERRQALADARLNDARTAVETLKQRTSSASEEKKAAAKKKIEEIKLVASGAGAAALACLIASSTAALSNTRAWLIASDQPCGASHTIRPSSSRLAVMTLAPVMSRRLFLTSTSEPIPFRQRACNCLKLL